MNISGCRMMIWANNLFSFLKYHFFLRKEEDVTTISILQCITLARMKDCTLRVQNKTTALFLYYQ